MPEATTTINANVNVSFEQEKFASWAILELMGHRRLGGFVQETTIAGGAFLRIDVPGDAEGEIHSTQFYSPGSVYCLTPCSEETAKLVARSSRPEPVHQWELPRPRRTRDDEFDFEDDD
jgi:hypothetical protein